MPVWFAFHRKKLRVVFTNGTWTHQNGRYRRPQLPSSSPKYSRYCETCGVMRDTDEQLANCGVKREHPDPLTTSHANHNRRES